MGQMDILSPESDILSREYFWYANSRRLTDNGFNRWI